jgi:uncharacterized membrane protein
MLINLKTFFLTTLAFLGIDFVWLTLVAKKFYDNELAAFERIVRWPAVVLIYLLLALGVNIFVLPKAGGVPSKALIYGGLLGLIAYATYDLTNFAILKNFTLKMTVIDILWGTFIVGSVSFLVASIIK